MLAIVVLSTAGCAALTLTPNERAIRDAQLREIVELAGAPGVTDVTYGFIDSKQRELRVGLSVDEEVFTASMLCESIKATVSTMPIEIDTLSVGLISNDDRVLLPRDEYFSELGIQGRNAWGDALLSWPQAVELTQNCDSNNGSPA